MRGQEGAPKAADPIHVAHALVAEIVPAAVVAVSGADVKPALNPVVTETPCIGPSPTPVAPTAMGVEVVEPVPTAQHVAPVEQISAAPLVEKVQTRSEEPRTVREEPRTVRNERPSVAKPIRIETPSATPERTLVGIEAELIAPSVSTPTNDEGGLPKIATPPVPAAIGTPVSVEPAITFERKTVPPPEPVSAPVHGESGPLSPPPSALPLAPLTPLEAKAPGLIQRIVIRVKSFFRSLFR